MSNIDPEEETTRLLRELEEGEKPPAAPTAPLTRERKAAAKAAAAAAAAAKGAEPPAPPAPTVHITNASKHRLRIGGIDLAPGDSHTLTERDLADERRMAKVNHAVKLGVLSRGAD